VERGVVRPLLGFKSFHSATATLDGIEVVQKVRKKQFGFEASGFSQFAFARRISVPDLGVNWDR